MPVAAQCPRASPRLPAVAALYLASWEGPAPFLDDSDAMVLAFSEPTP